MKRLFGNIEMKWLAVIIFAVITGIYTGAVMLFPVLKDTSFQDIGISYEWWVIFAVIIVVNCDRGWKAMLKCFVFFLVSQPLVYAVEVLFGALDIDRAFYYYRTIWLPVTFLTLPGGFIAYFCKKQNILGSVILGLGNTIQMFLAVTYLSAAVRDFPHHLLSGIICVVSVFVFSLCIQKQTVNRLISLLLPVLLTGALIVIGISSGLTVF